MKKIFIFFLLVIFLLGCKDENSKRYSFALGDSKINAFTSDNEVNEIEEKTIISRKLIKNGRIIFETGDLKTTKNKIVLLVKKYNGYISSDSQNEYDNRINNHLKIRIPSQKFDTILSGISEEVQKFDTKEIKISDVTEEFLDIQARLNNKKELEKRYLVILKKAKTVKEILDVEKEIGQLREDIEAAEGKLKYLQNQVSFSTLDVSFYKTVLNKTNFSRKFKDGFKNGFENLKSFFIGLINIWPFIILLFLAIFFFRRWLRKNKNK